MIRASEDLAMSSAFVLGVRECDADSNVQLPHTARVYLTAVYRLPVAKQSS